MGSLVDLIVHVVLGQSHVYVGPVGDEGDKSIELLGVVGEGVGDGVLLVVVGEDGCSDRLLVVVGEGVGGDVELLVVVVGGEDGGGDGLLVVGAEVSAAYSSSTLSLTQAFLHLLDYTSECIAK